MTNDGNHNSPTKKEPDVLSNSSLVLLGRSIGKEHLQGLELAMYLNIPTAKIISIINDLTTDCLTKEGLENIRMAVTAQCLLHWKKMTKDAKTKDRVHEMETALRELGKTDLADLFIKYDQNNQELTQDMFDTN